MSHKILIVIGTIFHFVVLISDAHANSGESSNQRELIKQLVIKEANNFRLPVPLALAVAKVESNFDALARSHKGARGVMQIMPRTARGEYGIPAHLLWNPRINIRLGLHFLRRLLVRYNGRVDLALSYYNGGSAVGDLPNARVIPATRGYVRKVRAARRKFARKLTRLKLSQGSFIEHNISRKPFIERGTKRGVAIVFPDNSGGDRG